jgi:hypothetical protein
MKYADNVDITRFKGPALDQGSIGSCAENGLSEMVWATLKQAGQSAFSISRLQSYYDTRQAQGTPGYDSGSVASVMFQQAQTKGLANESLWQYNTSMMYATPTEGVYADAALHKVTAWREFGLAKTWDGLVLAIQKELQQGKAVGLAMQVGGTFQSQSGPLAAQVNSWSWDESTIGHFVVVERVDWNLNGGSYVVKNSWGSSWGDNGYGTIKFTQFVPQSGDFMGAYAIDKYNDLDFTYTSSKENVAMIYACVLDRAPEAGGLTFWNSILSSGWAESGIVQEFMNSAEGQNIYAGMSNAQFVTRMYQQINGRAPDQAGFDFYMGLLNNGTYTRSQLMASTMDFMQSYNGSDSGTMLEHDRLMNITDAAMYYGIAAQADGNHYQAAVDAVNDITHDPATAEIAKMGISQDLGYL